MTTLKRMLLPLWKERLFAGLTIVLGVVTAGLNLSRPLLFGLIVGELVKLDPEQKVGLYVLAYACSWIMSWTVSLLIRYIGVTLHQRILVQMRVDILAHLLNIPLLENERQPSGRIQAYISSDLPTWANLYGTLLAQIVHSAAQLAGASVALMNFDPELTLMILPFLVLGSLAPLLISKLMVKINRNAQDAGSHALETLSGLVRGTLDLRSLRAEQWGIERFKSACMISRRHEVKRTLAQSLMQICGAFSEIGAYVWVLWWGGRGVLQREMQLSELIGFLATIELIFFPARNASDLASEIHSAWASAQRVLEFLSIPAKKRKEMKEGDLALRELSFRYPGEEKEAVRSVNCTLRKGELLVIMGESGSGKSTFLKLISGEYTPTSGQIDSEGRVPRTCSFVGQDPMLFDVSVRDNLSLGRQPDWGDVEELAGQFRLDTAIREMPQRYDTIIRDNGSNLSVGQKKRMGLVRALLVPSDCLIFDEPTAGLDRENADRFWTSLLKRNAGKTRIVTTHRLEETKFADRVFIFKSGQLVEAGAPCELLRLRGEYGRLMEQDRNRDQSDKSDPRKMPPMIEGMDSERLKS